MKVLSFRFLLISLALIFALSVASPALAHVAEPRLEINIDRINPGGIVDLRGVAFDYEEAVTLVLIGSQADISLGEINANLDGEFIHMVELPADLAEGTYHFRATSSHHFVLSPPLTVWGTALIEGGEQGPRDEDDPLLAPMPTFPPAVVTAPLPQAQVEATSASSGNLILLVLTALTVIAIAIGFGIRRKPNS